MIPVLETADRARLAAFDDVIDVRSPAEFAEDHIPGAINLPVLSNAERALVGTIYVQESRFRARRLGAALVSRNIARHLEEGLAEKPGGWAPLVYCWRGGQRSHAMATVLEQVGWRPTLLAGGYRTWRRRVNAALYQDALPLRLVLLEGPTGAGKTDILQRAGALGAQVLDLEGLAAHRGSLLGALPGQPQPSQKLFETRLLSAIEGLDPARPVLAEAESSRIGEITLPPALWAAMRAAPAIAVDAPAAARARFLAATYAGGAVDLPGLLEALSRLPRHHASERKARWRGLATEGAWETLAAELVAEHYDPAYARSRDDGRSSLGAVRLANLGEADRAQAARAVVEHLEAR